MNSTLKSMLIAAAAITSVSAFAQDKATLDLLVKKGLITAEERAKTLDEAAKARSASGLNKIFIKEDATKRLTFAGRVQTQYESISGTNTSTGGAESSVVDLNNGFMRRLYLGFKVDMGEGISAELVNNFADNTLDKAIFTADSSYGTFILGYQKVQWGLEENTSSSKMYTIERSASNRYWNEGVSSSSTGRLGFGARHTGLHYAGKYAVDAAQTLEYGASIGNASQGQANNSGNDIGTFANLIYSYKISDTNKHSIGLNWGSARDTRAATGTSIGAGVNSATISGFNPYIKSQFDNLIVQAEFITTTNEAVTGSVPNAVERKPEGYTILAAYKFTDQIEGVVRYSQLDTDGAGAGFGGLYRDASQFVSSGTTQLVYNKFDSFYVGVNYYFVDHNAKIMLGYENAKASGLMSTMGATPNAVGKTNADIFRLQAQVLF
jgi:phosphate-selective porin